MYVCNYLFLPAELVCMCVGLYYSTIVSTLVRHAVGFCGLPGSLSGFQSRLFLTVTVIYVPSSVTTALQTDTS